MMSSDRQNQIRQPDREGAAASRPVASSCTARAFQAWGGGNVNALGDDWDVISCVATDGMNDGPPGLGGDLMYPVDSGHTQVPAGIYLVSGIVNFFWDDPIEFTNAHIEAFWYPDISIEGEDLTGGPGNLGYVYGDYRHIAVGAERTTFSLEGTIQVTQSWSPKIEVGAHGNSVTAQVSVHLHLLGHSCGVNHILTTNPE